LTLIVEFHYALSIFFFTAAVGFAMVILVLSIRRARRQRGSHP
jgi:hypothetical protein